MYALSLTLQFQTRSEKRAAVGLPELAATPVVMLTARAQASDRDAALDAGADRFVPKPFSPLELASIVESLLDRQS